MTIWLPLFLALLPSAPARAEDEGAVAKIIGSLGSEAEDFAGCERSKKKPLVMAAFGGPVRQVTFKCQSGAAAFDAFLSYQSKSGEPKKLFLKEAFFRATSSEAEILLDQTAERIAGVPGEAELAFAKYRAPGAILELTVSLRGFSWTLLSGATYYEKLKEQKVRQTSVDVAGPVTLRLPGGGKIDVAVTTFPPGWSLVHLIPEDGDAHRVALRLPAPERGRTGKISAFPVSADETVVKFQGEFESEFYRVDPAGPALTRLGLVERATVTKDTETRYALMPAAKAEGPFYAFELVRVEVKRDPKGNLRSTSERVVGRCIYEIARRDYTCPKL